MQAFLPRGTRAKQVDVQFLPTKIKVGLRDQVRESTLTVSCGAPLSCVSYSRWPIFRGSLRSLRGS